MILLPVPPSTNELFIERPRGKDGRARGRFPSPKYTAWKIEAGVALKQQRPISMLRYDRLAVHIGLDKGTRGDIDNRAKALLDLLVSHQVIGDDSKIDYLLITRGPRLDKRACVEYWPLEAP